MADKERQNVLFAELAGRALLQPDFREAVLEDPEKILGQAGLTKEGQDVLVRALKSENLDQIKVADIPDLFGSNRWGFFGSIA